MSDVAVPVIIVINVFIFYLWNYPPTRGMQGFLQLNFVASRMAIQDYSLWTLATCLFLHKDIVHLFISTLGLITIGLAVEDLIGSKWFFEFFVVAGAVGALNHVMIAPLVNHPTAEIYGATGSLTAIMVLAALIYRNRTIYLFQLFPLKPSWGVAIFLALDILGMPFGADAVESPIGHGSHLAGALIALIYYNKVLRHRVWRNLISTDKEKKLFEVKVSDKMGWIIPCRSEEYDDMVDFLRDIMGMPVSAEGKPEVDNKVLRYTNFKMPNGSNVEVVEPDRFSGELYSMPMLSLTVDNLAAVASNMDARKIEFVAPIYHLKEGWAIIYFRGPDNRVYQVQGPYPNQ